MEMHENYVVDTTKFSKSDGHLRAILNVQTYNADAFQSTLISNKQNEKYICHSSVFKYVCALL